MKNFNELFKNVNLTDYAAIPFWSWNNELDEKELVKQINEMKAVGMGGFIMHARTGLTTEYLGEKWFSCVEACLDEAKRLGMNAWIYDENGWPSGFVGGELLKEKENLATYLELEEGPFNSEAYAVFIREKGGFCRVEAECGAEKYYNVMLKYSPANTDILKPSVVTKFIDATYGAYYERFADRFGKELVGFFTDEPQYFRWGTPFTVMLEEYFPEHYNECVRDGLIHLFFDGEEDYPFRVKYYAAMNELYTINFYKRLYDWCNEHGCKFTGHSVEETWLFTQMWGGASCMPSYEFETIPGIDNLEKYNRATLSARQVGSVAAALGKKQVLTETFGCAGFGTSPRLLKNIAEKQYVHGVNLMCHHLYDYSISGQGKTDHPPCFSKHMTWNKDFKTFNDYFTRLGYVIAEGKDTVNAAVLSPMTSIYLNYKRFDEERAKIIDYKMVDFQNLVAKENIEYHILDEKLLLKHARVEGKQLILGNCRYDYLMLPYIENVYSSTEALLRQFVEAGGKIYVYDSAPIYVNGARADLGYIKSNVTLEEIKRGGTVYLEGDGVEFTHREIADTDYVYMLNQSENPASVRFDKGYLAVDVLSGDATDLNGEVTLEPWQSVLLVKGLEETKKAPQITQKQDITDNFKYVGATDNNLTLDYIRVSFDGESYGEPRYVYDVFYTLIKQDYKGDLWIKYEFDVEHLTSINMLKEVDSGIGHTLNGQPLTFTESEFDVKFCECDLTPYLKKGVNEYVYKVYFAQRPIVRYALYDPSATESVRNCLYYDMEIEPIYLKGQFSVQNRVICAPMQNVPITDVAGNGFKFFAGDVTFSGSFTAKGGRARLRFEGEYMTATVTVNGREYRAVMDNYVDIETAEGVNDITLTFTSSLRNMMGPFHCAGREDGISPYRFRMYNVYDLEGDDTGFVAEHRTIPFGMTKITLEY